MICLPFFLDQFTNCHALTTRLKMGVTLTSDKVSEVSLRETILEILRNKQYLTNAQKAKAMISDRPIKSKDLFLYWVNYVMRHNGAKHLISEAPYELNIFQFWSVDVIAFLVFSPILALLAFITVLRCLCGRAKAGAQKQKAL